MSVGVDICDHCGDTPLQDGVCPVCSQQVRYRIVRYRSTGEKEIDKEDFPLCIYRGPMANFKSDRPFGRSKRCAVVAETEHEHLTACGNVERKGRSVSGKPPDCRDCRVALRRNLS